VVLTQSSEPLKTLVIHSGDIYYNTSLRDYYPEGRYVIALLVLESSIGRSRHSLNNREMIPRQIECDRLTY